MTLEPCPWVKYDKHGEVETVIFARVDDFVIGIPSSEIGQKNRIDVQKLHRWGSWEIWLHPAV
eukprot:3118459-Pyramimonas_sp.AAC.1